MVHDLAKKWCDKNSKAESFRLDENFLISVWSTVRWTSFLVMYNYSKNLLRRRKIPKFQIEKKFVTFVTSDDSAKNGHWMKTNLLPQR